MSTHPPPPVEMPPEIVVDDRGPTDVKFVLPHRTLGLLRIVGMVFIVASGFFVNWNVRMAVSDVTMLHRPLATEDYVMAGLSLFIACFAYFPIWLGLTILAGRRVIEVRGGQLRTTEQVGFLWRTKRWPLAKFDCVQIVPFFPAPPAAPKEGTTLSRLDALAGVLTDGTRFMIAPGYERRLLYPVADELARRCNARNDAAARPPVIVTTLVTTDPVDEWNDDDAKRPAASRAIVDEYPEGLTITLPPAGYRGGGCAMLVLGVIVTGFMAGLTALGRGMPDFLRGIFAAVGVIGLLIAIHGVRVARRRAVIAVVGPQLMVLQTGLIRSRERKWDVSDLAAVRMDKSGMEINQEPVLELQIVPKTGLKFELLAGRDEAEIRWIAALLRQRLKLPAKAAVK